MAECPRSVPLVSLQLPQTDTHTVPSHTAHIHSLSKQQCFHLFLLVRLWSNLSLRNWRKMEEEGKWENNEVRSTDTIDQTMLCCICSQILVLLGFFSLIFMMGQPIIILDSPNQISNYPSSQQPTYESWYLGNMHCPTAFFLNWHLEKKGPQTKLWERLHWPV